MNDLESIIDYNYEGQRLLFEHSKRIETSRYTILTIDEFDDDYLNLAINIKSKTKKEFDHDYTKIKEIMSKQQGKKERKVSILITDEELLNTIDFSEKNLEMTDHSIWLILDQLKTKSIIKSNIKIEIKKAGIREKNTYIDAVKKGFLKYAEEDPYDGLSESVIDVISRSFSVKNQYTTEHYMAVYNDQIVGTITVMYKQDIAYIYNVTTNINHRKKGICKQLVFYIINRLIDLKIDRVILQTE